MKITSVILLVFSLHLSAKTSSQVITFSGKNVPLKSVFIAVEEQTGFYIVINEELLLATKPVSVTARKVPLSEFLKMTLKDQGLDFLVENKTIILRKKASADVSPRLNIDDVAPPITGVVTNADGQPLAGASVKIKGSNTGTITDSEGKFTLDAAPGQVLIISYVGYSDVETIARKEENAIKLNASNNPLDEVVFKGYYKESARLSTGNVSKITAAEIERQPIANPLQALQGRASGVYIQQESGIPGGGFTIQIRGRNSIAKGNDPLYVIDGVPFISEPLSNSTISQGILGSRAGGASMANPLNNIDPNSIERIEVLKDADATAIYGSRGANGVVLITTKKGKGGKAKVNINYYAGASKIANRLKVLNTQQYLAMREEAFQNDGLMPEAWDYDVNGTWSRTKNTDWQKTLLGGSAQFMNAQVAVSGGSSTTQFLFSGNFQKQGLVFPGDFDAKKVAAHFSVNHTSLDKKFTALFTTDFIRNNSNLPETDLSFQALILPPNAPDLYDASGKLNWENSTWWNPLSYLERKYRSVTNNLIANVNLGYQLLDGLKFSISMGVNNIDLSEKSIIPSTFYDPAYGYTPAESYLALNNASSQSYIVEPQVEFSRTLGNSVLTILVGSSMQQKINTGLVQEFRGFPTNELIEDVNSASSIDVISNGRSDYRYQAVFGRLNYDYKKKYIINLTARRDGSSRFGPENRYSNFGAIGAGWIFTNEDFIKNSNVLSFGKLRGSYGTSGNDQIGDYQYLDTYISNGGYNGVTGLFINRLYNPQLAWELNKKLELGLELGFLSDQVFLKTSFFRNRSSNQLVNYPIGATSGFQFVNDNLNAVVQNTGFEIDLTSSNIKTKSFTWATSANLTFPKNKLISFPNLEASSYAADYVVGKSINMNKRYRFEGVDSETGLYRVTDVDGDGVYSIADRISLIETDPRFYGGLSNTFTFKGLSLDIFFQFVSQDGNDVIDLAGAPPGTSFINQVEKVFDNRWRKPGDRATRQRFTTTSYLQEYANYTSSDGIRVDASFVRLKNVSLSYAIPKKIIKVMDARIYVQGQNIYTFTNFEGLDPENNNISTVPPLRTLTAGIQITL